MKKQPLDAIVNRLLSTRGSFSSGELARAAGISRQAVHRHVAAMVAAGRLVVTGRARAARYSGPPTTFRQRYARAGLKEDEVWSQVRRVVPEIESPERRNARAALGYAFTEMLNNAIDHSGSADVEVDFAVREGIARFSIIDQGIGVYENVRARLGLSDVLAALQEISKGKVTTQPKGHSGQGIFFTSKVGDLFELEANGLYWTVDNRRNDVAISNVTVRPGTTVRFEVSMTTATDVAKVFAQYSQDDFQFDTSRIVVKLFEHGVEFVSRSEAKRIVANLDRFRHVIIDFKNVEMVGQGFADEIFRVWASEHPEIRLEAVEMKPTVRLMVEGSRVTATHPESPLIPDNIRQMDFPLGWTEAAVRKVLEDPDGLTQLTLPQDPDGKVAILTRRNARSRDWSYLAIIVARGDLTSFRLVNAFILPRRAAPENLWANPIDALKTFVEAFGREFTVGQSRPKRFFLDETYPLANLDPATPAFHPPRDPNHRLALFVRARNSELGAAVLVNIGYVIDYEPYAQELTLAGIHNIDFS